MIGLLAGHQDEGRKDCDLAFFHEWAKKIGDCHSPKTLFHFLKRPIAVGTIMPDNSYIC